MVSSHHLPPVFLMSLDTVNSPQASYRGQLIFLITIHGGALLFDVNGRLDFASVPLLFFRQYLGQVTAVSGSGHRTPMRDQCLKIVSKHVAIRFYLYYNLFSCLVDLACSESFWSSVYAWFVQVVEDRLTNLQSQTRREEQDVNWTQVCGSPVTSLDHSLIR